MRVTATTATAQHEGRVEGIYEESRGTKNATLTVPGTDAEAAATQSTAAVVTESARGASSSDLKPPHLPGRLPRKAASADSIRSKRSGTPQPVPTSDALPPLDAFANNDAGGTRPHAQTLSSPPSSMSLSSIFFSKVTRKRAISTYNTDYETSAQEESDFDRSNTNPRSKVRVRSRLLSLRSTKTSGSASETPPLQPPSAFTYSTRTVPSTASSVAPALPDSDSSVFQGQGVTRSRSVSKEAKRPRSQSVGNSSASPAARLVKRLSVGNQTPKPEITQEVTIAVLGPSGCGKTTFVRKSLKRRQLSAAEPAISVIGTGSAAWDVHSTRRSARLTSEFNTETLLTIHEFDSSDWLASVSEATGTIWPPGLPSLGGAFVCYDASNPESFAPIVHLLAGFKALNIPTMVLACKIDLEKRVDSEDAARIVNRYAKVVEISQHSDEGKGRMRKAIDVLVRQIIAASSTERSKSTSTDLPVQKKTRLPVLSVRTGYQPPAVDSKSPTSLASQPSISSLPRSPSYPTLSTASSSTLVRDSMSVKSTTRARSLNDLLSEQRKHVSSVPDDKNENIKRRLSDAVADNSESLSNTQHESSTPRASDHAFHESTPTLILKRERPPPPSPFWTLDELFENLFFLAVTGDDGPFITHFFLTYRRFTTPRCLLLGMQKRMNEWRLNPVDTSLSCFAQLRLCGLLEQWMSEYPSDFAVIGTHGALNAFIRNLVSHTHTLAYGSDFLNFLDSLPSRKDEESGWALKGDDFSVEESDNEMDSLFDVEPSPVDTETEEDAASPFSSSQPGLSTTEQPPSSPRSSTRERRSSLPLNAIALIKNSSWLQRGEDREGLSEKEILSKLQKTAANLVQHDADLIANEITRRELDLLLKIHCRDFMRHVLVPGKKDPNICPIAKFNSNYNDLHEWAVSIILCQDKPKARARQIEKLAEVAVRLRVLNNYSGLRAIITAITQATDSGDPAMELFRKQADLYKKFLSSDILFRTSGSNQSYRMALRNTKGACIPSLEVHLSDLHRADEANPDFKPDEPSKINWAKFNMMGKFVETVTSIQQRCCGPTGYRLNHNENIAKLFNVKIMNYEMQLSRMT